MRHQAIQPFGIILSSPLAADEKRERRKIRSASMIENKLLIAQDICPAAQPNAPRHPFHTDSMHIGEAWRKSEANGSVVLSFRRYEIRHASKQ